MRDEKAQEIQEDFNQFDRDGNGKIDFGEFTELMDALDANLTGDQARLGFEAIDTDRSGQINFNEFLAWWSER